MLWDEKVYKDDNDLAAAVTQFKKDSESAFRDLREIHWVRDYLHYHSRHDPTMFRGQAAKLTGSDPYPYESKIFLPETYQQIETAAPRLSAGVLGAWPPYRLTPEIPDNDIPQAHELDEVTRIVQGWHNQQLHKDVRIQRAIDPWLRNALIYGTTVLFVEWVTRKGKRWYRKVSENSDNFPLTSEKRLLEDRLRVSSVPLWHFYPDPIGHSIRGQNDTQPCRACARGYLIDIDRLWQSIEGSRERGWAIDGKPVTKKMLEKLKGTASGYKDWHLFLQAQVGKRSDGDGTVWGGQGKSAERLIPVIDFWEEEAHIVHLGGDSKPTIVLKELGNKHPYLNVGIPFVLLKPTPLDHELFGISTAEMIANLNHAENTLLNARMENIKRAMDQFVVFDKEAFDDPNKILSQPWGVHAVTGMDVSKVFEVKVIPDVTANSHIEIERMHQHIQRTGGGSEGAQGVGDPNSPTARGTLALLGEGNTRYARQVRCIGEDLAELGRVMHGVDQQYLTRPRIVRLTGRDGEDAQAVLTPDMLKSDFEFAFDTRPEAVNKAQMLQLLTNAMPAFSQYARFNMEHAIVRWATIAGEPNPRKYLKGDVNHAEQEHKLFEMTGRMPQVEIDHDHQADVPAHLKYRAEVAQGKDGEMRVMEIDLHLEDHMAMVSNIGGAPMPDRTSVQGPEFGAGGPGPEMAMGGGGGMAGGGGGGGMGPLPGVAQGGGYDGT